MKIDANPLQADANYAEPLSINMVEVSTNFIIKPVFGSFIEDVSKEAVEMIQKKATQSVSYQNRDDMAVLMLIRI